MNFIILKLEFWVKLNKSFFCLFTCSNNIKISSESSVFRCEITTSSSILLYFAIKPFLGFFGSFLSKLLHLNWNISDLLSWHRYVLLHKQSSSLHVSFSLKNEGSHFSCFLWMLQQFRGTNEFIQFSWIHSAFSLSQFFNEALLSGWKQS